MGRLLLQEFELSSKNLRLRGREANNDVILSLLEDALKYVSIDSEDTGNEPVREFDPTLKALRAHNC